MKLKTLKDFETEIGHSDKVVLVDELRAETIKWVKFLQSGIGMPVDEIGNEKPEVKEWIIDFFNITEKELK